MTKRDTSGKTSSTKNKNPENPQNNITTKEKSRDQAKPKGKKKDAPEKSEIKELEEEHDQTVLVTEKKDAPVTTNIENPPKNKENE